VELLLLFEFERFTNKMGEAQAEVEVRMVLAF
jgi:hypothetical protein